MQGRLFKMQRRGNSTSGLTPEARAWLRGEERQDFFEFKPDEQLEALWNDCGDHDTMFYRRDMARPISLEALEQLEDAWLSSGDDESDKYGSRSFFIRKYYTDSEKSELWEERGDKKRFHWQPDMFRPEAKT
jgi:hypothetical protein